MEYFQKRDYLIIVVTNQSGIARGYYSEQEYKSFNEWMVHFFKEKGIIIDRVYYCPHHPINGLGKYKIKCQCRKPAIGMFRQAQEDFSMNLEKSILVGDKKSDIDAGLAAKIGKLYVLFSKKYTVPEYDEEYVYQVNTLDEIIQS